MNAEGNRDFVFARNIGEAVCLWSSVMALQRQPHGGDFNNDIQKDKEAAS